MWVVLLRLFAPVTGACDVILPFVVGGETGFVRLGGCLSVVEGAGAREGGDALPFELRDAASSFRIFSALLRGLSARLS